MTLVDVHSHYIPDFLLNAFQEAGRTPSLSAFPRWSPELAIEAMDRSGIRASVLSVSTPGVHFGNNDVARRLARQCNEFCAQLKDEHPDRFGAFAAVPLPDIQGAIAEIAYALDTLKLEGVGLLASYGELFLGADELDPVMDELDARKAVVFVHPAGHPSSRALKLNTPLWILEYPIDTTRAAANLLLNGKLARYPNIRFILAHAGGALPYLTWRISSAPLIDQRYSHLSHDQLENEIGKFYYEIAQAPGDAAFGSLRSITDPTHILFGSDWPYCSEKVTAAIRESFSQVAGLSSGDRENVSHLNAARLFPNLFRSK